MFDIFFSAFISKESTLESIVSIPLQKKVFLSVFFLKQIPQTAEGRLWCNQKDANIKMKRRLVFGQFKISTFFHMLDPAWSSVIDLENSGGSTDSRRGGTFVELIKCQENEPTIWWRPLQFQPVICSCRGGRTANHNSGITFLVLQAAWGAFLRVFVSCSRTQCHLSSSRSAWPTHGA